MPVASTQTIADNARGFAELGPSTLKAIIALALYREAAALGYSVDASINGIVQAASCDAHCLSGVDLLAALTQRLVTVANLAGAALPTGTGELANLVSGLERADSMEGAIVAVITTMNQHAP